jgi:hypothetical protein
MIQIIKTTIEMVVDAELVPKKKGGHFLKGFCKDVTAGEWSTFVPFVVYDASLASELASKATKGKRLVVTEAQLKSRRYEGKHGKQTAYELVVEAATAAK